MVDVGERLDAVVSPNGRHATDRLREKPKDGRLGDRLEALNLARRSQIELLNELVEESWWKRKGNEAFDKSILITKICVPRGMTTSKKAGVTTPMTIMTESTPRLVLKAEPTTCGSCSSTVN